MKRQLFARCVAAVLIPPAAIVYLVVTGVCAILSLGKPNEHDKQ
jgi:hypothetical protein